MVGKQTTNSALRKRVLVWEGSLIDPVGGILGALVFHGVMASTHKGLGNQLGQFAVSVGIGLAGAGADSRSRRRPRSCRQGPSQPSHQRSGRTWRGMSVPSSGGWPPAASLRPPPPRRSGQAWPPRASIGGAPKILPATFAVIVATVALYGLTAAPVGQASGRRASGAHPATSGRRRSVGNRPRARAAGRRTCGPDVGWPGAAAWADQAGRTRAGAQ